MTATCFQSTKKLTRRSPAPALIISLDFELHWGVTERVSTMDHPYIQNLLGVREAVRQILEVFEDRSIHATWATVGKIFADGRDDLESFYPNVRPTYENDCINTYRVSVGNSAEDDPLHFAPELIRMIALTPGQEVASHTFSHYYCGEPGQDIESFRADLSAAKAIADRDGIKLRSLVFPRNQVLNEYRYVLPELGFDVYRGNPSGAMYHLPPSGLIRQLTRVVRLTDSFVNLTGNHVVSWSKMGVETPANVCASHFLRPYSRKLRWAEFLRIRRVKAGLRAAARKKGIYHLWWHPHNFGVNLRENMMALESILDEFDRLRDLYGMKSLTMAEAADVSNRLNESV